MAKLTFEIKDKSTEFDLDDSLAVWMLDGMTAYHGLIGHDPEPAAPEPVFVEVEDAPKSSRKKSSPALVESSKE